MDKAAFDKLVKDAVDAELAKHEEKQLVFLLIVTLIGMSVLAK